MICILICRSRRWRRFLASTKKFLNVVVEVLLAEHASTFLSFEEQIVSSCVVADFAATNFLFNESLIDLVVTNEHFNDLLVDRYFFAWVDRLSIGRLVVVDTEPGMVSYVVNRVA